MAKESVTAILYGADRNLWNGPASRLTVRDVNDAGLKTLAVQDLF